MQKNFKVISLGYRCQSASILQLLKLKIESYPFDWTVSNLNTIINCIEDNFVNFLKIENYKYYDLHIVNIINNDRIYIKESDNICKGNILLNEYYCDKENIELDSVYHLNLALPHRNIFNIDDYNYYKRCINRLHSLLEDEINKYYLYIHNLISIDDYNMNKKEIFIYFDNFNKYILTKTKNIFGIYFILVKMNISNNGIVEKIKIENINYNVYVIYVNPNFIDYNLFYGDNANELKEILNILEDFFYKL
jgi:hypothetical protein